MFPLDTHWELIIEPWKRSKIWGKRPPLPEGWLRTSGAKGGGRPPGPPMPVSATAADLGVSIRRRPSNIPGQLVRLTQGLLSSSRPWHGLPPCWGAGSVQVRDLVSSPSPQSAEHVVQSLHLDQWPSTVNAIHNFTSLIHDYTRLTASIWHDDSNITWVAVWLSGNPLASIDVVTLRQTGPVSTEMGDRLWARVNHLSMQPAN